MNEYKAITLLEKAGIIGQEDAQKKRMALFRKYAFRQTLTALDADRFLAVRANYARDAEHGHQAQKDMAKAGNYEAARWIKNEVIRPNERMVRAFDIGKVVMITGVGRNPDYPLDLLAELQMVNTIAGDGA